MIQGLLNSRSGPRSPSPPSPPLFTVHCPRSAVRRPPSVANTANTANTVNTVNTANTANTTAANTYIAANIATATTTTPGRLEACSMRSSRRTTRPPGASAPSRPERAPGSVSLPELGGVRR